MRAGLRDLAVRVPASRRAYEVARRTAIRVGDAQRRLRFGKDAPLYAERLWVDPWACAGSPFPKAPGYLKTDSARVVDDWPPGEPRPVTEHPRIRECLEHWMEGLSWEETGRVDRWTALIRERGLFYRSTNRAELLEQLARWDAMFETIKREGRLRTRQELDPRAFREEGGIGVHVGPSGRLFKGRDGHHRFAMALALRLPVIPVMVGVVHRSAIPLLADLRVEPPGDTA